LQIQQREIELAFLSKEKKKAKKRKTEMNQNRTVIKGGEEAKKQADYDVIAGCSSARREITHGYKAGKRLDWIMKARNRHKEPNRRRKSKEKSETEQNSCRNDKVKRYTRIEESVH
jgi:hypothetical protein